MKRKAVAFTVLTVMLLILVLNMIYYVVNVKADAPSYAVEWVNHQVKILYNGYILVNDTIKVDGDVRNGFLIGFPYRYAPYVLRCIAYDTANFTRQYNVVSGVPLNSRMGFYGFNVALNPQPQNGVFSVIFVLSNSLLRQNPQNTSLYTLDFPAYPSLVVNTSSCNASVVLPQDAKFVSGTGTVNATNYLLEKPLPQFTYEPANMTFQLATDDIQLFTIEEFKREINFGSMGEVAVSDSYFIRNESPQQMTTVKVSLPLNATGVRVEDEFGRRSEIKLDARTGMYTVNLFLPVESGKSSRFIVRYNLPKNVSLTFFKEINYYVKEASITVMLPEGAKIASLSYSGASPIGTYGVSRDVFQEKITISRQGILSLDSFTMEFAYQYNPLWLAFRPTLWVWALAVLGCAIVAVWRRPKAPEAVVAVPTVAVRLSPEILRKFVESYEERRRITSDIKSLEVAVSKGRIPRQRYKVQRKTLETRLASLSRSLDELKLKLRSAGGRYADLMRQLEVAETELNEVESNIRSIEARHRRGNLTLEAYRKLLADYESRREKAETTISGILLRIREEIR
ncbi:MAG: hypothetical protein QW791_04350 [Candidatus Bathyarchaeia archaeon]